MRLPGLILSLTLVLHAPTVLAQQTRIGLAAPLSGPSAILGQQMQAGARAAATAAGADLTIADDACTAEGGAAAAQAFIAANVSIATGFLCTEAVEAALPLLKNAGIPALVTGVRTNSLTDRRTKTGWLVARLAPRADAELAAATSILIERWRTEHFAIVDDGTIYSRELAEGFRNAAEQAGLKPVFIDTYRPQLDNQIALAGRLRKAGATHVFIAGDRADIAIIGRDAAQLNYPLTIAGGEVLRATPDEVDLTNGTLMVGLPEWADIADPEAVAALRAAGIEPEGYVLPAYASVQIAAQATARATAENKPASNLLAGQTYPTILGSIRFTDHGERAGNLYRLYRYQDGRFEEVTQP